MKSFGQFAWMKEIDEPLMAALVLGGPFSGYSRLGLFGRLLPVPIHIPSMDLVEQGASFDL